MTRFWNKLTRDPYLFWLLVFSGFYFLFCYFTDPVRPANIFSHWFFGFHDYAKSSMGWSGFNDQGDYLRLAHTLANFNFSQLHHTFLYGLGYPLVAVPFLWLGLGKDPFVFFNLFAFIFAIYATYKAARHFISPVGGLLAGFGLAFATPLVTYVVQPWNTTICLVTVSGILLVATVKKVNRWHFLILGVLVGWAFSARYADAVFLGILALAALYRGSFKKMLKPFVFFIIGACIFTLPTLYAQNSIFGSPFKTPYVLHMENGQAGSDQALSSYDLGNVRRRAVATLVGPRSLELPDTSRGLLVDMFWTLAAIPGFFILYKKSRQKLFLVTLAGFTIVVSVFYLSFRGVADDAVKFGLLHYFKMLWPGAVIFAVAFFDNAFAKVQTTKKR